MASPPIIGHLQSRLRKTLKDRLFKLGEVDIGIGIYSIVNCTGIEYQVDEESNHKLGLFPFRIVNSFDYWLSLSFKFNSTSKVVTHVTISFHDESKNIMFRADWANNESQIIHAQPHWHILNKKLDFKSPLWDEEAISIFQEEVQEMTKDKIRNIHFSMSLIRSKTICHVQSLKDSNDEEVLNWIEGVLIYIFQQLTYIHDKSMA